MFVGICRLSDLQGTQGGRERESSRGCCGNNYLLVGGHSNGLSPTWETGVRERVSVSIKLVIFYSSARSVLNLRAAT